MKNRFTTLLLLLIAFIISPDLKSQTAGIPLSEHPRPDFERRAWLNLNGSWDFRFDKENKGLSEQWNMELKADHQIMVPFPWGSPLSGVRNEANLAWYSRTFDIPTGWNEKRIFLVIGACDWYTSVWVNGKKAGEHQGGYTPFEFEITNLLEEGKTNRLTIRVDDTPHDFKLEGKQGYGEAKGIWQTIYLEPRGSNYIRQIHFTPDIDTRTITLDAQLEKPAGIATSLKLRVRLPSGHDSLVNFNMKKGNTSVTAKMGLGNLRLWNLDDPWLYETKVSLLENDETKDEVNSYFGMRKISVVNLPGTSFPYIALNNKPVYLQLTLDQCYHPEGFYTYPSDAFMRDEIIRSKKIGLNGNRLHIKVEVPRKLYWADKLGLLIMADVPNSWGQPGPLMRKEWEQAMHEMIARDFNHPAIFSWILFNETWGLFSEDKAGHRGYADSTAAWVKEKYYEAKKLDPTRLVEDNSACNNDHVISDINSWHAYLPGYRWKTFMQEVTDSTFPGSGWNYRAGARQNNAPMINSECGNVWGYNGSAGDVDWSWDYHRMMNVFRMNPKMGGWLYTEHHDVINEWNGYYRYDRGEKITGLGEIVPGMSLNDLHSPIYLSTGQDLCKSVMPEERIKLPVYASFMSDLPLGDSLVIHTELYGWDQLGVYRYISSGYTPIAYKPWYNGSITSLQISMPSMPMLAVLSMSLEDASGNVLHRNFRSYLVNNGPAERDETIAAGSHRQRIVRFAPDTYNSASWKTKTEKILGGLKVWGDGSGYFEYRIPWPKGLKAEEVLCASLVFEASAKRLNGKDKSGTNKEDGDYMRGAGFHDPSLNPNSYPMSDYQKDPSVVYVRINNTPAGQFYLEDDPADSRGILSWFYQKENGTLSEAGSFGYLVVASINPGALKMDEGKEIIVRLEVSDALPGGLAIYGEHFGRYPVDPSLVFELKGN